MRLPFVSTRVVLQYAKHSHKNESECVLRMLYWQVNEKSLLPRCTACLVCEVPAESMGLPVTLTKLSHMLCCIDVLPFVAVEWPAYVHQIVLLHFLCEVCLDHWTGCPLLLKEANSLTFWYVLHIRTHFLTLGQAISGSVCNHSLCKHLCTTHLPLPPL